VSEDLERRVEELLGSEASELERLAEELPATSEMKPEVEKKKYEEEKKVLEIRLEGIPPEVKEALEMMYRLQKHVPDEIRGTTEGYVGKIMRFLKDKLPPEVFEDWWRITYYELIDPMESTAKNYAEPVLKMLSALLKIPYEPGKPIPWVKGSSGELAGSE